MNSCKSPAVKILAGLALASNCAYAAIIVTPTGATSTTQQDANRALVRTIDASGLFNDSDKSAFTGTLTTANISDVVAGAATTFFGANTYWLSGSNAMGGSSVSTTETLTYNLGGTYDLTSIYFWNYLRDANNRALKTFDIAFSTDGGVTYSTAVSAASLGIGNFTLHDNTGVGSNGEAYVPVDQRDFTATQEGVTHIQFTSLETYGSTGYVGFAEIRFGAIPEPSTALLGGLGLLALLRRRRR